MWGSGTSYITFEDVSAIYKIIIYAQYLSIIEQIGQSTQG
jgi:hypothetical protein